MLCPSRIGIDRFASTFIFVSLIVLAGCSSANIQKMVPTDLDVSYHHPFKVAVQVEVEDDSKDEGISAENYRKVLVDALESGQVFERITTDDHSGLTLKVLLLKRSRGTDGGTTFYYYLTTDWVLLYGDDNSPLHTDHIQTNSRAGIGDAFAGWSRKALVVEKAVRENIELGISNLSEYPILSLAAMVGNHKIVDELVQRGSSVNTDTKTPLMAAALNGNLDMVQYLVEKHGANPDLVNSQGESALNYAARSGELVIVQSLLDEGALLSSPKRSVLLSAIEASQYHLLDYLLVRGASPDGLALDDETPVVALMKVGRGEDAQILIENGANLPKIISSAVQESLAVEQSKELSDIRKDGSRRRIERDTSSEEEIERVDPMIIANLYRMYAEHALNQGHLHESADYFTSAAEEYTAAANNFDSEAGSLRRQKLGNIIKDAALATVVAVGGEIQAREQARQLAQIGALSEASRAGEGLGGYFERASIKTRTAENVATMTRSETFETTFKSGELSKNIDEKITFFEAAESECLLAAATCLTIVECIEQVDDINQLDTCIDSIVDES